VRHPWQLALSLLGIALGVAVVVSVELSSVSAERAFVVSNRDVLGSTTHQILGGPSGVDEADYVGIKNAVRPAVAAPVVEGTAGIVGIDGRAFVVLGIDPFSEAPLRSHLSVSASYQRGAVVDLLTQPNAALLGGGVANTLSIRPGEHFSLRIAGRVEQMRLVGLLGGEDQLRERQSTNVIVVDIATARTQPSPRCCWTSSVSFVAVPRRSYSICNAL